MISGVDPKPKGGCLLVADRISLPMRGYKDWTPLFSVLSIAVCWLPLAQGCSGQSTVALKSLSNAERAGQPLGAMVTIDGHQRVLALDTAAYASVIGPEFADYCPELPDSDALPYCTVDGGQRQYVARRVEIGTARARNVSFWFLDLERMKQASALQLDGILGANILNLFCYSLDIDKRVLRLQTSGSCELRDAITKLRLRGNHVYVPVQLGDQTVELLLDSGASWSSLDRKTAEQLARRGWEWHRLSERQEYVDWTGEATDVDAVVLGSGITLGECHISAPVFAISDDTEYPRILGINLLRECAVTVDVPEERVSFSPSH